ncbi:multidrug effflux MFS transporter [Falsigemmobacter intermedius]|uniref:multidrug effflux MFS transporter n=1 Tax=Falsigemmobacter intermedius TaxID=1553448 RepID=UPI003F06D4C1
MTEISRPKAVFLNPRTPPHIGTLILMAGVSAATMNIFLPNLSAVAEHYNATPAQAQLTVSLYLAVSGVMQLVIGPLADRYGRRPILLISAVIFILASVAASFAPTMGTFLLCRMLQAVIASAIVLSRAIVRDMVPADQAASMIGYVTMAMSLVPMLAPTFGGLLGETFGWQASLHALSLLGCLVLFLVWRDLGETLQVRQATMGAQLRAYPVLLKSGRFWGYAVAAAATSGAFFCFMGGAPIIGSRVYHLEPSTLGLYMAAPGIGYLVGNFLSGRLSGKVGILKMVVTGNMITLAGVSVMVLTSLIGIHSPLTIFGLMPLVGLGNGLALPSASAGMMSVRADLIGSASGLGAALTIGGGAALSALAGVVLTGATSPLPLQLVMLGSALIGVVALLSLRGARGRV